MRIIGKAGKGFTIIESVISTLLLTIALLGGMAFYFYSNQHLQTSFHRRIATEIANSQMEEIKKNGYHNLYPVNQANPDHCQSPTQINIRDLSGNQTTCFHYIDPNCTQVSVEIDWQDPGKTSQQSIRLATYITPY